MHLIQDRIIMFSFCAKLRLKTAGPCFGDHIIPYHKAKMLYLSNLEKNFFRIAGALKLHFFGFSVLTIKKISYCGGCVIKGIAIQHSKIIMFQTQEMFTKVNLTFCNQHVLFCRDHKSQLMPHYPVVIAATAVEI